MAGSHPSPSLALWVNGLSLMWPQIMHIMSILYRVNDSILTNTMFTIIFMDDSIVFCAKSYMYLRTQDLGINRNI